MNLIKLTVLMTGLTLILVALGNALGGQSGMMFAFVMSLMMNVGTYWFSDKMVLRMYRARQVTAAEEPTLVSMVRTLSQRARLPMPKVYVIPGSDCNAFATGRNPEHSAVAVTEGMLSQLSAKELSGVIGHELAHIHNRDILISTIVATFAGAITMIANMAQWAFMFGGFGRDDDDGGHPLIAIMMMILAPIAAMLIQMAISRSREYLADEVGAKIHGDPKDLADALRQLDGQRVLPQRETNPATAHMFIVSPLRGKRRVLNLFSTHPPLEERIKRLEKMSLR